MRHVCSMAAAHSDTFLLSLSTECPKSHPFFPFSEDTPSGYGSIPIHTIFSGMNIHLPAILIHCHLSMFLGTDMQLS